MQILKHQHDRGMLRQAHQQTPHRIKQLQLLKPLLKGHRDGRLVGQLRQQPTKSWEALGRRRQQLVVVGLGGEPAQSGEEGDIGEADVADLQAPANQHLCPLPTGLVGQLSQQPSLADPSIAGYQHYGRLALLGLLQGSQQSGEFLASPDEPT